FVRARPQLLILNQVASIGADLKGGIYADGDASLFLRPPYFCFVGQGKVKGAAFAFFKATGISEKDSPTKDGSADIGPPFMAGDCSDAGASDAADASTGELGCGPSEQGVYSGSVAHDQKNSYTLTAGAGEGLEVRVADTGNNA